jgi:hypothetical protein
MFYEAWAAMMKIVGFAVATMFPRLGAAKVTMERLSIQ